MTRPRRASRPPGEGPLQRSARGGPHTRPIMQPRQLRAELAPESRPARRPFGGDLLAETGIERRQHLGLSTRVFQRPERVKAAPVAQRAEPRRAPVVQEVEPSVVIDLEEAVERRPSPVVVVSPRGGGGAGAPPPAARRPPPPPRPPGAV
jgi:hypothetical protein